MINQIIEEVTALIETGYADSGTMEKSTPDSDIYEELGLDSLDALELFSTIEARFNITGLDDKIESIKTIRDIAIAVEASMGHKS